MGTPYGGPPLGDRVAKWGKSSWNEYVGGSETKHICKKDIILEQFKSKKEYKNFALSSLKDIQENKEKYKEMEE